MLNIFRKSLVGGEKHVNQWTRVSFIVIKEVVNIGIFNGMGSNWPITCNRLYY